MSTKILILRETVWKDFNIDFFATKDNLDILNFESVNELPQTFSQDIYSAILVLVQKINSDLIDYIKKLRVFNNNQIIFVLGTITNKEFLKQISILENSYFFEKTSFLQDQVEQLFQQLSDLSKNFIISSQANEKIRKLILDSPENILTVNSDGMVIGVNSAFKKNFGFSENQIVNNHVNKFIPNYRFDDILNFKAEISYNKISTTFMDKNGRIVPVEIKIVPNPNFRSQFYLYVSDLTEKVTYNRLLEKQNRFFTDLKVLIDELFTSIKAKDDRWKEYLIKLFKCDNVFQFYISNFKNISSTDLNWNKLGDEKKEIVNQLLPYLKGFDKKTEVKVIDFNEKEDIFQIARSAVFIPVSGNKKNQIIILLYANHFEPDVYTNSALKILKSVFSFLEDTSEHIKKSTEINRSFKEIVENALDGIYRSTLDGKMVYANPALIEMLGYNSMSDLEKLHIEKDLYEKADVRSNFVASLTTQKGVKNFVANLKKKNGEHVTVLEHAHLVKRENEEEYIEGVLRDISESRQLESNLKNTKLFSNNLIEYASVIITVKNTEYIYLVWNKKAEQVTGYKKEEVLGKSDIFKKLYPDEKYRTFIKQQFSEYFFQNSETPIEVDLMTKTGQKKTISWTAVQLKAEDGSSVTVDFGIDITEMRNLEKRFNENRQMELFNSVTDKIAREYKTLVSAVLKPFEQLGNSAGSENFDRLIKETEQRLKEADQFSDLITSLSAHNKGKIKNTDPDEVIEHSIYFLNKTIPSSIKIEAELNARGLVDLDEAQLNQIILNLALNSVSALKEGGQISIKTRICDGKSEPFLIMNSAVKENFFKLVFTDNGKGMDETIKSRMFEPFFTTSSDRKSKGLGSTLILNIVKSAKGFIDVDSQKDKGTTITIYLPVRNSPQSKNKAIPRKEAKILVVDDQQIIRELLSDLANTDGYTTLLAKDGMEGLKLFEEKHQEIGLAILDIIMPKLYGSELYYRIKKIKPDVKVIITYGHHDPQIKQQLKKDGVDGFLPKPFDIQSARDQIRTLLP